MNGTRAFRGLIAVACILVVSSCATAPEMRSLSFIADACALPSPPKDASVVILKQGGSEVLSTAALGGFEEETYLTDVAVEPGPPLYVVLMASERVIWRFSGATDRLVRVTAISEQPAPLIIDYDGTQSAAELAGSVAMVGLIGVPRGRAHFLGAHCLPRPVGPMGGPPPAKPIHVDWVETSIGRTVDRALNGDRISLVGLPSGKVADPVRAPPPAGYSIEDWSDAVRFYNGGVVHIDPKSVLSTVMVASYPVMPSQVGVSQLVGSGHLEPIVRTPGSAAYRIRRAIPMFPPGMGGAHRVVFVLAKDVPLPAGDPVHSCVFSEGAFAVLDGHCGESDYELVGAKPPPKPGQ